jgi:hypothetical protein
VNYYDGYTYYYRLYTNSDSDYLYSYQYYDSDCVLYRGYASVYQESECNVDPDLQCAFFSKVTSITYLELDISSYRPITASFVGDNPVHATITENSLVARGSELSGVVVKNGRERFRVQKQVSPTQYSSTFGVFQFGETYSSDTFKFSVSSVTLSTPPNIDVASTYITLAPFISVSVSGEDEEYNFLYTAYNAELVFRADDDDYSLAGLTVSNPIYGLRNMTLYPEFQVGNVDHDANLVFQLEASSSPFITTACYLSESSVGDHDVDFYYCEFSSMSVSWGSFGSWGSWSFDWDDLERKDAIKPDHMSFSLF